MNVIATTFQYHGVCSYFRGVCIAIILSVSLGGCTYFISWDDVMEKWIGHNIVEIEKIWGKPASVENNINGNSIYVYPKKRISPTCIHYWIVDENGVIVGLKHEGSCRPV